MTNTMRVMLEIGPRGKKVVAMAGQVDADDRPVAGPFSDSEGGR